MAYVTVSPPALLGARTIEARTENAYMLGKNDDPTGTQGTKVSYMTSGPGSRHQYLVHVRYNQEVIT
jgi:hypothetical protein